jgi:sigma-B regulation protein RsbU (phosphoserine phosphatase)
MKDPTENKMILPHISYHKILNQIKDGIFITDLDRKIVFWNSGAVELTGLTEQEMLNKHCYDAGGLCKKDHKGRNLCNAEICPIKRAINDGYSGIYPHLIFMETKWGQELPVSINVGPIHDLSGIVVGGICVFRDMRDEYRQRKLAGEIQKKMITLGKIRKNGIFVESLYKPVDEIGGDFLEAFFLDDKNLIATIADATGHGISASLFTVIYKTLLHSSFASFHNPAGVLEHVNRGFLQTTQIEGYYITAAIINFNPATRSGKIAFAGHPPALLFHRTGPGYTLKKELTIRSIMIGVEENIKFQEIDFFLENDDILILASDGLYEAQCSDNKPFGTEGIANFLADYQGYDMLNDLLYHLNERSLYTELMDDVSIIKIELIEDPLIER